MSDELSLSQALGEVLDGGLSDSGMKVESGSVAGGECWSVDSAETGVEVVPSCASTPQAKVPKPRGLLAYFAPRSAPEPPTPENVARGVAPSDAQEGISGDGEVSTRGRSQQKSVQGSGSKRSQAPKKRPAAHTVSEKAEDTTGQAEADEGVRRDGCASAPAAAEDKNKEDEGEPEKLAGKRKQRSAKGGEPRKKNDGRPKR